MLLGVQISLQQYPCLLIVNVFPLISVIVLGDFLFYVTAVNKMFNWELRAMCFVTVLQGMSSLTDLCWEDHINAGENSWLWSPTIAFHP